jgi:hypothetical protein
MENDRRMKANMSSSTPNGDFNNNSSGTEKKTSNLVQTSGAPGGMRGGFGGSGGRPGEENSNNASSQKNEMLSELLKNSLGDEQVLIPVGIQMTKEVVKLLYQILRPDNGYIWLN